MENMRVESESGVPPLPKPPDGEGEETTAQPSPAVETQPNPTQKSLSVNSGDNDLHGDWILNSKPRRQQKSRDLGHAINAKDASDKKSNSGPKLANKFDSLKSNIVKDSAQTSHSKGPINLEKGPIFSASSTPPKILSRKKRPRKELVFGPIKIVQEEAYKPFMKAIGKYMERHVAFCADREEILGSEEETCADQNDVVVVLLAKSTSNCVKKLPGGIKTVMDVEAVGPNRLRFLDEPKPPDDRTAGTNNMVTEEIGDSMKVQNADATIDIVQGGENARSIHILEAT
ncbi:hypothetical protein SESBI_37744 [Sesbania bispinosa]|nr:hypothetical protein SESBI_37744 [Sesbania bispinosa]